MLEARRAVLVGELHRYDELPGSVASRVRRVSSVVGGESLGDIGTQAHVCPIRLVHTPQDVDETLASLHGTSEYATRLPLRDQLQATRKRQQAVELAAVVDCGRTGRIAILARTVRLAIQG